MESKMPKIIEKTLIIVALLIGAVLLVLFTHIGNDSAGAEFVYSVNDNNEATVEGYTGDIATLIIPEKLGENDEYTVKYINTDAFTNDEALKKVVIPGSVEKIGKYAFSGCKNLRTVELSEGLYEIGYGAFFKCSYLKNIELPESLERIDDSAFEDCKRLKNLRIPKNCEIIGTDAFLGCENLILDASENSLARDIAEQYAIPTDFKQSSDSTMLKAGILIVLAVFCVFILPKIIKKFIEKRKNNR